MAYKNSFFSIFFASKEDLITGVLKDLLTIQDICSLDTSACNHENRNNFLTCLEGYKFNMFESTRFFTRTERVPLGDCFLNWARQRHVSVKKLCWKVESINSSSILEDLCVNHSWDLTFLDINLFKRSATTNYLESDLLTDLDLLNIAENSLCLEVLDVQGLSCVSDDLLDSLVNICQNLRYLNVDNCRQISIEAILIAESSSTNLQIIHNADDSDDYESDSTDDGSELDNGCTFIDGDFVDDDGIPLSDRARSHYNCY
jgi:hypothetical protein